MRAAVIENGVVSTVVDVPSLNVFEGDVKLVEAPEWVVSGATWDGEAFTNPTVGGAAPRSVTMRKARLALLNAGLLDDVEAAILSIPDQTTQRVVQIEWEYAQTVDRDSVWVKQLTAVVGLTDSQLDALFVAASKL